VSTRGRPADPHLFRHGAATPLAELVSARARHKEKVARDFVGMFSRHLVAVLIQLRHLPRPAAEPVAPEAIEDARSICPPRSAAPSRCRPPPTTWTRPSWSARWLA
jgi:hypothetical protein